MATWRNGLNPLPRHDACVCICALFVLATRLPAQTPPRSTMPDSVRQYVSKAMVAFRSHSVHQAEVDWRALEDSVLARAANAQNPAGTWAALTWALRTVDAHSLLMPPEWMMKTLLGGIVPSAARPAASRPLGTLLDGGIGLVIVPPHGGPNRPA